MEIKFKTNESNLRVMSEKSRCAARIIHNAILGPQEIAADIARQNGLDVPKAGYMANVVATYIINALSEGKRLDFGLFSLSLTMKGSIMGANGTFDPEKNSLGVHFLPSREAKEMLATLHPVNATGMPSPHINSILDGRTKTEGTISLGVEVFIAGSNLLTATDSDDEGVWLCDKNDGRRILAGRVLQSSATTLNCIFDSSPAVSPGRYRFELATRSGNPSPTPSTSSRLITLVRC